MLFSSPPFFGFFAVYLLLHLLLPGAWRLPLIIIGSTIFYSYWNYNLVGFPYLLLGIGIVGTWWLVNAPNQLARRRRMLVTVTALLLPLIFFKYSRFLISETLGADVASSLFQGPLPLPLGISFITFTLIGYAVDVYRRAVPLERRSSLLTGAVMFFPHLIAGPVVLPRQLIYQLEAPRSLRWGVVRPALLIFTVGLIKKLVFADQISTVVNPVFNEAGPWTSLDYLLAVYGFSLQIYCDFSGYSDMAIGLAMLLGVKLPRNFEQPYTAQSIVEFWQRWHITLSNWLRDYLYIPLGGNRYGIVKQVRNVIITMALGGLWHGANWTFLLWGLAHGGVIALFHVVRHFGWHRSLGALPGWFRVVLTFHFVTLTWILFRAKSVEEAWRVLEGCLAASPGNIEDFLTAHPFPLGLLVVFFLTHRLDNLTRMRALARKAPMELFWPMIVVLWILAITISAGSSAAFIYFDF